MQTLYNIDNDSVSVTTGNSPLEIYTNEAITRTKFLEGAILSDVDCTLKFQQGKQGSDWLVEHDLAITGGTGQAFEFRVTCRQVRLTLVRGAADAAVQYELNHRTED